MRPTRNPIEYLSFIQISSGRVLRFHAALQPWFQNFSLNLSFGFVDFGAAGKLDGDFSFTVREIEMRDSFRNGEKLVNVVRSGKHRLPALPRRDARLLNQANHLRLPFVKRAEVTIEK